MRPTSTRVMETPATGPFRSAAVDVSTPTFGAFRAQVLRTASLQESLQRHDDLHEFPAHVMHLATQRGLDVNETVVRAAMTAARRSWVEASIFGPNGQRCEEVRAQSAAEHTCTDDTPADELHDWFPIRVYAGTGSLMVDWCHLGDERFTEPFFDQTVENCLRRPFSQLFRHQTPISVLEEIGAHQLAMPPAGFIFHMSRCGSTLVGQMLAADPRHIVIAEADPIDAVLRSNRQNPYINDDQRVAWLRGLLGAYGRTGRGEAERLYVKFDSWSVVDLPLIRRAFPDVPWIFLYREPAEVVASHERQRGSHLLPGTLEPELIGLDRSGVDELSLDEYGVRVLGEICRGALQHHGDGNGRLVNYAELPERMWPELCSLFRAPCGPDEVQRMRAVARFHSKRPNEAFGPESERTRTKSSESVRALTQQLLDPLYAQLEAVRNPAGDAGHTANKVVR